MTMGDEIPRVPELQAKILKLTQERDEARQYAERLYTECVGNARIVACAFCGQEFDEGTPRSQNTMLTKHVKICEKHPMRDLESQIRKLTRALSFAACCIKSGERWTKTCDAMIGSLITVAPAKG